LTDRTNYKMKICIVSEAIKSPFDEGVKIFVYNFIKESSKEHEVLALSRTSDVDGGIKSVCEKALPENRFFVSLYLRRRIRSFMPDVIFYLPTAHATVFSFIRARMLKLYWKRARTVLITLQPRDYSYIARLVMSFARPDFVFAQSDKTYKVLKALGCEIDKTMCGVDLEKFTPVDNMKKAMLRRKHGFAEDKYYVLHVGHINRNRNAQFMARLQNIEGVQAVIIGSTSYPEDEELVEELKKHGVMVITSYIEKIEELYQCADCYVFPVLSEGACIEIPLSIFEAMACNLSVVSTKFGGLPEFICQQDGFHYVEDVREITPMVDKLKNMPQSQTRTIAEQYSWEHVVKRMISAFIKS
jgi:glycosyltransferase involved in cell wall biosynthesis